MNSLKANIIALRSQGYSYNEIKRKVGCSKSTISYHCKDLDDREVKEKNIISKNQRQKINDSFLIKDINVDLIIEMKKNKLTYKEIKEKTGFSINVIGKVCRIHNLTNSRKFSTIDDNMIVLINQLYQEIKSTRKVASKLNISRDSVRKYLDKENNNLLGSKKIKKISASKSVVDWRKRTKSKLVEYKGGSCCKCGYNKSNNALQFHHLDPREKDFTVGGKSWSFEKLKKEVDKCILVCANCHIEIHEQIQNSN